MKNLFHYLLLFVASFAVSQAPQKAEAQAKAFFHFLNAESEPSTQDLVDEMNDIGDFNISVKQSTSGKGGVFTDINCTTLATTDGAEIMGWKTFGNNPPATSKNLQRVGTPDAKAASKMWYKFLATTNVTAQLRVRSESDMYARFYNGHLGDFYYETNPTSITTVTHPVDIIYFVQFNFGTESNETSGDIRWGSDVVQWSGNGLVGGNLNTSANFALGDNMIRYKIDASGNAEIWLNGVSVATGSRTFSTTERRLGSSSHVLTHNVRAVFMKFGTFTAGELTTLETNSNILWPRTGTYPYPYVTNNYQNTSSQWNGTAKQWEPGRNLTPVFQGGNGTLGTAEYYWVYWSSSDVTRFPVLNKLDEHYQVPGSIHISTVDTGDAINSVSVDGVVITSGTVNFNTDATTTATDLATNINGFQTRYFARASSTAVQISDNNMTFDPGVITFSTTGFTATKVDPPRGQFLNRNTYAVTGQIFSGVAGNGTTQVMRISRWFDSVGYAGDPWQTKWHLDNIP